MIVIDASVLVNAIGDDGDDGHRARERLRAGGELAAPDLVDVEATAALRRRWLAGTLTDQRFAAAVQDLGDLDIERYPTLPLMRRAYELRANLSSYDAAYVALAEALDCALLTADCKLANTPGPCCAIQLIT